MKKQLISYWESVVVVRHYTTRYWSALVQEKCQGISYHYSTNVIIIDERNYIGIENEYFGATADTKVGIIYWP